MNTIIRHAVVLAVALILTWMLFFGANYFGVVWTHYFAGEPPRSTRSNPGEVSVKIVPNPTTGTGLCDPHTGKCSGARSLAPKPHG